MIDERIKLTVLHDDNATFTNHTNSAADYTRDTSSFELSSTEDYLYLGFYKPFSATYVELTSVNTNSGTLTAEVFDGTSWVSSTLTDETLNMARSGFLFWDKSSMSSTTVNGTEAYFVRFRPSADHAGTEYKGINLVFSDDARLKQEFPDILNASLLQPGETTHISAHVTARNHIVQKLRAKGYVKYNSTTGVENITAWDLMDIFEVREAATYLALSNIFFNLSDDIDDIWWVKQHSYREKFEEMFRLASLTLDTDDDGVTDSDEKLKQIKVTTWNR